MKLKRLWNRTMRRIARRLPSFVRFMIFVAAGFFVLTAYTLFIVDRVGAAIDTRYCSQVHSPSVGHYEVCITE